MAHAGKFSGAQPLLDRKVLPPILSYNHEDEEPCEEKEAGVLPAIYAFFGLTGSTSCRPWSFDLPF
jgi:hypothetical protein